MKKFFILFLSVIMLLPICFAQAPAGYYNAADGKKGHALRVALYNIIKTHTALTYNQLWSNFPQTDAKQNGKVWDIYSDVPNGTPPYEYTFGTDQCGNYTGEGDCYNREHSMPKSWFGGLLPMVSDLFHIYPTDGHVNGKRSNMAYGEVGNATWTSQNGSKIGTCSVSGYSGTVFEPIDEYKGDLARGYFYMSTCYMDKNLGQDGGLMFTNSNPKPWALAMLIQWHNEDPVSQKEIDRNNAIYQIQHNRNPFIDYPELVGKIFGADSVNAFHYTTDIADYEEDVLVYPNPADQQLTVFTISHALSEVFLYDMCGKCVKVPSEFIKKSDNQYVINISDLSDGIYVLKMVIDEQYASTRKIIVQ